MVDDDNVLEVRDLITSFTTETGRIRALDHVSFTVARGQTLGIVGESGCGKSVTALSIMRLLPQPAGRIDGGCVMYDGVDLTKAPVEDMCRIRGRRISMIFQEPMTALNPVQKIGRQLLEVYHLHQPHLDTDAATQAAVGILERVGISDPADRMNQYPHQLSGGIRQRVMIAFGLACKPDILIADEPTTALDVTIQAQILDLMRQLQHDIGMSIIFITHDLGVIADICDDVMVMYAGRIAEKATTSDLFAAPRHPYTRGLLRSVPRLDSPRKQMLKTIEGTVPSLQDMPDGCRFADRCALAEKRCRDAAPMLEPHDDRLVACYNWNRELP